MNFTSIKEQKPNTIGWYLCHFYNGVLGTFYARKVQYEDGKEEVCISHLKVLSKYENTEWMTKYDITDWCFIE